MPKPLGLPGGGAGRALAGEASALSCGRVVISLPLPGQQGTGDRGPGASRTEPVLPSLGCVHDLTACPRELQKETTLLCFRWGPDSTGMEDAQATHEGCYQDQGFQALWAGSLCLGMPGNSRYSINAHRTDERASGKSRAGASLAWPYFPLPQLLF